MGKANRRWLHVKFLQYAVYACRTPILLGAHANARKEGYNNLRIDKNKTSSWSRREMLLLLEDWALSPLVNE